ncbi:MAG TPA: ATP-dependent DNA helicase RecG [Pirellulales bacterium]|jgi:ATP-dependent DNA helicase RecG|nr:ATP-dependent DNA helicase RecG [Pirellulales bacterium]
MPVRSENAPSVELTTRVQFLKGCGAARAERLAALGIHTVRDLLFYFPRDYRDLTKLSSIEEFEEGQLASVSGTIEEAEISSRAAGRSVLGVLVRVGGDHLRAVWFNQPFLRDVYHRGQTVLVSGKPKRRSTRWEMVHPNVRVLDTDEPPAGQLLPVYPLTEGLTERHVRQLVERALESCADALEEVFPPDMLAAKSLASISEAVRHIHFPPDHEALARARRRLVYQELLVLQLALALKRHEMHESRRAFALEPSAKIDSRIRRLLPFALTPGQNRAIEEIIADMGRDKPMHRLLQGDVGSGKTIVAVYAMLLAVARGAQVVLMAPTEVLARQHLETLDRLLAGSHTRLGLVAGGQTAKNRAETLASIASGEIQIVVGTQAVISGEIAFARLGLVIIDEQHKFGVHQRAALKRLAVSPHYLVMTATPIPRTISMTLFGDLDVTVLTDHPPGRQNVHTYLPTDDERPRWWEFVRKKIAEGRQAYVIAPVVEENEERASLSAMHESLANGELEAFRIGVVHGRMSPAEKQDAMEAFRRGDSQVLLATSVVEVGIDVPNATLMTIEGAERFGLAQLHQLRGRVSRGKFVGYCTLFTAARTTEADARLQAFVSSTDGFYLAEVDFALRGPGDLLGTKQHGLPPLRIADLVRDVEVLEEARADALELVRQDPELAKPEHARLRRMALARYGSVLDLGHVG